MYGLKRWFLLGLAALLLESSLACGAADFFSQPAPEIARVSTRDGTEGEDYVVWLDCTVRNNGAKGNVLVTGELRNDTSWTKETTVMVDKDTSTVVTIAFPEATYKPEGLTAWKVNCNVK